MPIRFRCGYCNRLLGIARRKAGTETTCPHCGYVVTVPEDPVDAQTDEHADDDQTEMEELEALLNPKAPPSPPSDPPRLDRSTPPAPATVARSHSPTPSPAAATVPRPAPP